MNHRSLSLLDDAVLLSQLAEAIARERGATLESLFYLAEVQERRLYRARGYESMGEYCVGELHLSEGAAYKRTRAAKAARQFPVLFDALADGRLHLSAVVALERYLRPDNVDELVAAATHKTRNAIERMLAERFPRPDVPTLMRPLQPAISMEPLSPGTVTPVDPEALTATAAPTAAPAPRARVTPLAPQRFAFQATLDEETVELLSRARALLGHTLPSGDPVQVLKRVLRDWVQAYERRKYGLTDKPRARRSAGEGRYIPASVMREVFKRDGGRCTFVGTNGHRCGSRTRLECDHVTPVARGGRTSSDNLRLRCRTHNQLEAERAFGAAFMRGKRERALGPGMGQRLAAEAEPDRARDPDPSAADTPA